MGGPQKGKAPLSSHENQKRDADRWATLVEVAYFMILVVWFMLTQKAMEVYDLHMIWGPPLFLSCPWFFAHIWHNSFKGYADFNSRKVGLKTHLVASLVSIPLFVLFVALGSI